MFDGQQTDERILFEITPHPLSRMLSLVQLVLLAVFFGLVLFLIASVAPAAGAALRAIGLVLPIFIIAIGFWWTNTVFAKAKTYITDRRIIRFDVVSPFFTTKRALFWNEALKAKAYAPNLLSRFLGIGIVEVEPVMGDKENVRVTDVGYFDDLANYIDKILFTFKNKPAEISTINPFVPKPRGHRDSP